MRGFTLIELSIVLVIIGLIVGGVLVSRELIAASYIRSQLAQIDKYQQAVSTFKGKYNYIPGDMPEADADRFGIPYHFGANNSFYGNGAIDGYNFIDGYTYGYMLGGEPTIFWSDLSYTKMIEGSFTGSINPYPLNSTAIGQYLPAAKLGGNTRVLVFSTCVYVPTAGCYAPELGMPGNNYFSVQSVTGTDSDGNYTGTDNGVSVYQAYKMDGKIDDGLPKAGRVVAYYPRESAIINYAPSAATANSTTCFDNTTNQYSYTFNNGSGKNCGLSFRIN